MKRFKSHYISKQLGILEQLRCHRHYLYWWNNNSIRNRIHTLKRKQGGK